MKLLLTFNNNNRVVVEKGAVVSPHPLSELSQTISLEMATDDEVEQLKQNPHNDQLISSIQKRKKPPTR